MLGLKSCEAVTNKRNRALRNFSNRYIRIDRQTLIMLTRERMDHILRRHHPSFWDGSVKTRQSFFDRHVPVERIENLITEAMRANEERISRFCEARVEWDNSSTPLMV